jgi:prophage regulatory protein
MSEQRKPRRMLRLKAVQELVPYSTSQIYAMMAEGKFPKNYPMGDRAVAWFEDEILDHQEAMIAKRDRQPERS